MTTLANVLGAIKSGAVTSRQVAERLHLPASVVRTSLTRLLNLGQIERSGEIKPRSGLRLMLYRASDPKTAEGSRCPNAGARDAQGTFWAASEAPSTPRRRRWGIHGLHQWFDWGTLSSTRDSWEVARRERLLPRMPAPRTPGNGRPTG
jgi:hypothetical protein